MSPRSDLRPNPFPGLRPFRSDEHHLFFGREEQTAALLRLLRTNRFLAVVGTSGSGKSSLVRAGLIAELHGGTMTQAGSTWEVMILRPGGSPVENLARAFVEAQLYDPDDASTLPRLLATLNRSRFGLVEATRQSDVIEPGTNLLVVVDQFEELFRFRQQGVDSEETAAAFVNLLLTAGEQAECPIYVAITMRSDYLGDCSEIPGLAEAVNDGEYLIPRLQRDQKRDAIEKPIGVGGSRIAPLLVQRLLNEVGDDPDQLPVLQHALMRTWDAWAKAGEHDRPVGIADFEATGGLASALSNHADEVYDSLPDDRHRAACERIFKTLTEKGEDNRGIRRPTRLARLAAIASADRDTVTNVLDAFRGPGVTFLMPGTEVELADRAVIDLSHESLMRNWGRLYGWVEDEAQSARIFRRLLDTARLWRKGKAGLFRDPDLQIAVSWREEESPNADWAQLYGGDFNEAIAFLETSHAAVDAEEREREAARQRELDQARELAEARQLRLQQQQRAARKLRRMIVGLAAVAAVAVAACAVALVSNHRANTLAGVARQNEEDAKRNEARARQSEEATANALAAVASQKTAVEQSLSKAEKAEEDGRKLLYTTDMRLAPFLWADDRTTADQLRALLAKHVPAPAAVAGGDVKAAAKPDLRGFEWNYYQHLLEHSAALYEGHGASVVDCGLTPDGRLATLDEKGQVRRWDLATRHEDDTCRHDLPGGGDASPRVLSPDGRRAALVEGKKLRVYDTSSGVETFQLDSPRGPGHPRAFGFSRDRDRLVVLDDSIRWVDASGEVIATHSQNFDRVQSLALSADGLTVAVVGHGNLAQSISVLRLDAQARTVSRLWESYIDGSSLRAAALSPDGRRLAFGGALSGRLYIRDASSGGQVAAMAAAHPSQIESIAYSGDGTRLATADAEGIIKIWTEPDTLGAKSSASLTLKGHRGAVTHVGFSAGDGTLASSSADKTARVWDLGNAGAAIFPLGGTGWAAEARFSPDGQWIAAAGAGVRLWDAATGRRVRELPAAEEGAAVSVAFSPADRRLLAVAHVDKDGVSHVTLWDLDNGKALARLRGSAEASARRDDSHNVSNGVLNTVAFSPDGRFLVAGYGSQLVTTEDRDSPIVVWDVATRRLVRELYGHKGYCVSLDFSPDGALLASGSHDGTAIVWSTRTWKPLRTLMNPDPDKYSGDPDRRGMVEAVAFSPDGKTLATGSRGGSLALWEASTGRLLEALKGHADSVDAVAFSPDGRTLASGSSDRTVRLWNVETRRELMQLDPAGIAVGPARSLAFSPDGKRLLVSGGVVSVWTAETNVWDDADRAAEALRDLLKSGADFRSRVRMLSGHLGLDEALAKLDPGEPRVRAALAAAQANRHASRGAWAEAAEAFDRLRAVDPAPEAWLGTPGLLRLARSLLEQGRPKDAASLLTGGAARRAEDGLPAASNDVSLGFSYGTTNNQVKVESVMPASPAARSGLKAGDFVSKVGDTELTSESIPKLAELLGGDAGTKLRLAVRRAGKDQPEVVELTREPFVSDPATGDVLLPLRAAVEERLAREPKNAGLLELRAELAGQWSDMAARVADYTAAIDALAGQEPEAKAADLRRLYARRGQLRAASGNWKQAADDFALCLTDATTDEGLLANQAEAQARAEAMLPRHWVTLTPVRVSSKGGTVLTPQADGSILPSGPNPDGEAYTVVAETSLDQIRTLRLEVLPHPSIQNGSTGRSGGRFTLTELTASRSAPGGRGETEPLVFTSAWSPIRGELAGKTIDGERNGTGDSFWNSYPREKEPTFAVFEVAEQKAKGGLPQVTFVLDFSNQTYKAHNLGRFRLSASSEPLAISEEPKRFADDLDADLAADEIKDPWAKLAFAYRFRGDQAAVDRLVERRPGSAGAIGDLFVRGEDEEKDWARAAEIYGKGITPQTTDVELLSRRAAAYEALRNWDAAEADWSRAAAVSPDGAKVLAEFARRLTAAGQPARADSASGKAQHLIEESLRTDPGDVARVRELTLLLRDRTDRERWGWEVLEPAEASTRHGSKLTARPDGSIRIEQAASEVIRWRGVNRPIQALRIESGALAAPAAAGVPAFKEYQIVAASQAVPGPGALQGRYVRLDLPGDARRFPRLASDGEGKSINLAELQVFHGDRNIALRRTARQSSDFNSTLVAANAVDGNTVGNDSGNPYAHTNFEKNP